MKTRLSVCTADFWIGKLLNPDKIIMERGEITAYNKEIEKRLPAVVHNLAAYPAEISGVDLRGLIGGRSFPKKELYHRGCRLKSSFYEALLQESNIKGVLDINKVRYAFTIRRTSVRTFPTAWLITAQPEDQEFDLFQETALDPAEPLLVLHESASGEWCFVQASFSRGWVPAADLAVTGCRKIWLDYLQTVSFLVVTGSRLRLGYNPWSPEVSELEFLMGSRIPLAAREESSQVVDNQSSVGNHVVKLPVRGSSGELAFKLALVPQVSDVSLGFLPYTHAGVIRQAFKMQGERYGWGGLFNSRDCSALIRDLYRSFGFQFPRNSREQELLPGKSISFVGGGDSERRKLLTQLSPGAILYLPGHVMFYLGQHQGEHYVIHAIASCGDKKKRNPDGTIASVPLNEIIVTTLSLPRRTSGQELLLALTSGKEVIDDRA